MPIKRQASFNPKTFLAKVDSRSPSKGTRTKKPDRRGPVGA